MSHRLTSINIVNKEHLDDLNHVNNVQYLYWAQEIAKTHWDKIQNLLDQTEGVWMVRSHEVNLIMHQLPKDLFISKNPSISFDRLPVNRCIWKFSMPYPYNFYLVVTF